MSATVKRELSQRDIDLLAHEIIPLLDGIAISQVRVVLNRAREIVEWTSLFDADSPEVNVLRQALQEPSAAADG